MNIYKQKDNFWENQKKIFGENEEEYLNLREPRKIRLN